MNGDRMLLEMQPRAGENTNADAASAPASIGNVGVGFAVLAGLVLGPTLLGVVLRKPGGSVSRRSTIWPGPSRSTASGM